MNTVLVRTTSHRSRDRLRALVGRPVGYHFSFHRSGYWATIPAELLEAARKIPGITKARPAADIRPCLNWE